MPQQEKPASVISMREKSIGCVAAIGHSAACSGAKQLQLPDGHGPPDDRCCGAKRMATELDQDDVAEPEDWLEDCFLEPDEDDAIQN
jgi:hypothetical protein